MRWHTISKFNTRHTYDVVCRLAQYFSLCGPNNVNNAWMRKIRKLPYYFWKEACPGVNWTEKLKKSLCICALPNSNLKIGECLATFYFLVKNYLNSSTYKDVEFLCLSCSRFEFRGEIKDLKFPSKQTDKCILNSGGYDRVDI